MGLRFCPLFSGSDGNCCFLEVDNRRYLIDAGFSGKKIESNLKILGIDPGYGIVRSISSRIYRK